MALMRKFGCLLLSFVVLITAACSTNLVSKAEIRTVGYVTGSNVRIRSEASTGSQILSEVSYIYVDVIGSVKGADGYTWYNIRYEGITGYIREDWLQIITYDDSGFEQSLEAFPESYRESLRQLHALYPNWIFIPDTVPKPFTESVKNQFLASRKQVNYYSDGVSWRSMEPGAYDWASGSWDISNGGWIGAAREVIAYYMDPRNFLNPTEVYQFLMQGYNPNFESEAVLSRFVAGTFLAGTYTAADDAVYEGSYVKAIMEAARQSGVSSFIIAGTIIQEQGVNGSRLSLGVDGYYNFFNFGASSSDGNPETVIANGIAFAKSQGWDSPSKSIIGGAKRYGDNYIAVGQDTYYYKDFNVLNPDKLYHQYAQNVYDARAKGAKLANAYGSYKSAALVFRIPVYTGLPAERSPKPPENEKLNNYYFTNISVPGLTPSFSMFNFSYALNISGDTVIYATVPDGASLASPTSYNINAGQNSVVLSVRAQTGFTNDYYLTVHSDCAATLKISVNSAEPKIVCGDTNGDGKITIIDLANVQKHLLKLISLTGNNFTGADTNRDGKITIIDLANIQKHLLRIITLTF